MIKLVIFCLKRINKICINFAYTVDYILKITFAVHVYMEKLFFIIYSFKIAALDKLIPAHYVIFKLKLED